MRPLDWLVLGAGLLFMVVYGIWKGRRNRDLEDYFLGDRNMRWYTVALSIMATQASAITFLSTPGQAYADGMRFVQFYFGLPIAMVILSVTAVPLYHRLKVFTAYEFLEGRFDLKTRALAALFFLIQRGLACGLTIYAPAIIISVILGWNLSWTIILTGVLVVFYTTSGGSKAVENTNFQQMLIILLGMFAAFVVIIVSLPDDVSIIDATRVAGKLGRLNAIVLEFDPNDRYNIWSGLIGGCFLALAYFGTDQSQVGRYLTGKSVTQSRLGLLFNGMIKIPMQFFILFVGAMVFAFYQFVAPPIFFNPIELARAQQSEHQGRFRELERDYQGALAVKASAARSYLEASHSGDANLEARATEELVSADNRAKAIRSDAIGIIKSLNPKADTDTNYVFLTFVINYLPAGLVGLVMAAVFAASWSSTSSELNALSSTTIVDFYRRLIRKEATDGHYVALSKLATFFWGCIAIGFALYAKKLGSLVEAVNQIGSLFYGTILGIFLIGFYLKRVGGTATFVAAIVSEFVVIGFAYLTNIAFLWYNFIACAVLVIVALAIQPFLGVRDPEFPISNS